MKNSRLFILFMIISISLNAQNKTVSFSRLLSDQEIHNPAYSAYRQKMSLKLIYHSQFGSLKGHSKSYGANFTYPVINSKVGSFLSVINEDVGLHNVLNIKGGVNSCVKISSFAYLSGGISLGVQSRMYRKDEVICYDDVDLSKIDLNDNKLNLGVGIYYFDPYMFAGIAINDVTYSDNIRCSNLDMYLGYNYSFFPYKYILRSSVLYKYYNSNNIFHIDEKLFYSGRFGLGFSYTFSYEWALNLDLKLSRDIWCFYSFENHFNVAEFSLKSHSIGLYYNPKYMKRIFKNVLRFRNLYN